MSVISKIKQLVKLKRKAYRDAYVEEHVRTSLPFQIRALREQRDWSQSELGEKTGMRQNAISRLEKPDYGSLSVSTLLRLASAFDVALLIKFVPFRKLLDEFSDLSTEALEVESFENEVPELEQVAAMPTNWYQGSYAQASHLRPSTYFDVSVTPRYIDDAGDFRSLPHTWETLSRAVMIPTTGTWLAGPRAPLCDAFRDALREAEPSEGMPLIDYTGDSDNLNIQSTASGVYYFLPASLGLTHVN